jgi:hypothetical protein
MYHPKMDTFVWMLSLDGNNNSKFLDDIINQIEKMFVDPEFSDAIKPNDEDKWKNFDKIKACVTEHANHEAYREKKDKILKSIKDD